MTKKLNLFLQLAKIDEAKREVWGIATAEIIDKEGEIFDYKTSKPYFKSWSDEISKATAGKSLGNVREMHQPSAVGKLIAMEFDDEIKQITVGAKIVDDSAWSKCSEGVYTGFSIGGSYEKAWKDGDAVRFTAKPVEISVVDNPCVPTAHFTAVKVDGTIEIRKFVGKAADLAKDMYSVSNLASLLQSAVYLQMDSACEAEYEADDSKIPEDLKTWVKLGADILARMTEEELNELTARMKAVADKLGKTLPESLLKAGAKHSADTKAHHEAIAKCMGKIAKACSDAQSHCTALMGKDMEDAAMPDKTKAAQEDLEKQVPAEVEPKIETTESTMNETQLTQLEKAAADSASSLSKFAEVEKSVTDIRAEMEANNKEINTTLTNILTLVEKLAPSQESPEVAAAKVSRTALPAVTVHKSDDNRASVADEELNKSKSPLAAMKTALRTPQDPRRYL